MTTLATVVELVGQQVNALAGADQLAYYVLESVRHHEAQDFGFNVKSFRFKTTAGQAVYPLGHLQEPGYEVPRLRAVKSSLWLTALDGITKQELPSISDRFRDYLEQVGGGLQLAAESFAMAGYDLQEHEGLVIAPPPGETGAVVSGRGVVQLDLPVANWTGTVWELVLAGNRIVSANFESPWFEGRAGDLVAAYAVYLVQDKLLANPTAGDRALRGYVAALSEKLTEQARHKPAPELASIFD